MEGKQPTWPQVLAVVFSGLAVIFLGYLLADLRERLGGTVPWVVALLCVSVAFFLCTIFFCYIRPQYGSRSLLFFALFIAMHAVIALALWRLGALR